jgi:glycolate oxidase FAD binding subunit
MSDLPSDLETSDRAPAPGAPDPGTVDAAGSAAGAPASSPVSRPKSVTEVEALVQWAVAGGKALEIAGHGTKRGIGRPVRGDATLDLSDLSGIVLYEPQELILTVHAGTPVADVTALLASRDQELAFEPGDYGPLLGGVSGRGTIGGIVAANVSGPRRIRAGAARDHLLGAVAVTGRGETIRTGGRVVKNVTGFDLCKLLAGSWGTLAVLAEITLKVLPRASCEATLVVSGLSDREAAGVMAAAMATPFAISGAAHLPDNVAVQFDVLDGAEAATVFRIEGPARIDVDGLRKAVRPFGAAAALDHEASRALWRSIADVRAFRADGRWGDRPLWRLSVPPALGHEVAARVSPAAALFYDWAGGLVWLAPPPSQDCSVAHIRAAVAATGGHATLVRASPAVRASLDPFQPEAGALAALTKRVKENFDPKGVLNPGRMWAGV